MTDFLRPWASLDWALAVVVAWLLIGVAGVVAMRRLRFVALVLFPTGAVLSLVLLAVGVVATLGPTQHAILPLGLPNLPFHLRLDALSAFFLALIGAASAGISTFAAGYFRTGEGTAPGLICLEYHVFLASIVLVVLADDAYAFMVMWESMALSSFFLVITNHRIPDIRRAGYLYLLIAHIGALAIFLCFGLLQANTGDYTFANMRAQQLPNGWASVAFALAVFGFGAKAGLLPVHAWLPEAHPAAPSPFSALMSGVMLKIALYGLLRVAFDLLAHPLWWWGLALMLLGLCTALFGVVFSTVQTEMKRLLAYSSIENIGLICTGLGLALLCAAYAMSTFAALALTAALYHMLSHAFFKGLLFCSTGAVMHATGERSLGKLGGLLRFMPWVGWPTLVGVLACAGLPPFGGFVAEWLLLQTFLFTTGLPSSSLDMLVPVLAAWVALVAALSGYTMVKYFGVVFLGQPREEKIATARDAGIRERIGMLWLAAGCVLLGLFPNQVIAWMAPVTRMLVGGVLAPSSQGASWLLVPVDVERASYAPLLFLLGVLCTVGLTFYLVRKRYHGRVRRVPAWGCGYPVANARMQDSAEGFGQPIRQIFAPFFLMHRNLPSPWDTQPQYRVTLEDPFWRGLYLPVAALVERISGFVALLQRGRIAVYLLYSFGTLLLVLWFVMR
ncbi:hydrogenase 4 subunit B [Candidatus Symbiobacter mobilis]|uniref:NADH dehydrogenase n=1 Tax=Candidatus Symbiobacter mobilis CR TaxID=946483 RepID=U5N9J6_9BURK|nr:hydrogenase 4 subunit B [Candidatus Symbiobacter mobilis]AGX87990.1 NADH dehydrogenase [Candidatus Symbiobacter mobilis CR]